MDAQPSTLITRLFEQLEADDPRADNARHYLTDILVIALLAVMCGVDDYPGIVEYGRDELPWLRTFLRLPHGIPSVSTFRRVFARLHPSALNDLMQRWGHELAGVLADKQVVLDGKTLRRSFDHAWKKTGLHVVTAWCVQENLVLAQQAVDEKSNEITAVPQVLGMLDLKGAVVTVDALNTQKEIARQIVQGGGDYLMALKDNHPSLCHSVQRHLDEMILEKFAGVKHVYHESTDAGHGRIDLRQVWATQRIDWLEGKNQWTGLRTVAVVQSTRKMPGSGASSTTRRYYIGSVQADSGRRIAQWIRNHWSIENSQHWCLDMAFNEDQSRVRKDHGDQNLAILRRIALGLLRRDRRLKLGVRNKRLKAARNRDYLLGVLLNADQAK